jgi:hypothetical protein
VSKKSKDGAQKNPLILIPVIMRADTLLISLGRRWFVKNVKVVAVSLTMGVLVMQRTKKQLMVNTLSIARTVGIRMGHLKLNIVDYVPTRVNSSDGGQR